MLHRPAPPDRLLPTSVAAIAAAVNGRVLDPVTVAELFAARVADRNPALNAIVAFDRAVPLRDAATVRARIAAGEVLPIAGVPVVVKDCIFVEGLRVTQGCRAHAGFVAPRDAVVVERIRGAGGIVLGLGNMSELGCRGVTDNPLYGPTRHPLDPRLTPGGSSGGPAAAVAAALAPCAIGTDAGGSSRRPPAHVGVVGFKPTNGAVPDVFGYPSLTPGVNTICPIGDTVDDVARLFAVIVGEDRRDPFSIAVPAIAPRPATSLRIAFSPTLGLDEPIDGDVADALCQAVDVLRTAGLRIERTDPAWPPNRSAAIVSATEHAGLAAQYGEAWRRDPSLFDPHVGGLIEAGLRLSAVDAVRARMASLDVWQAARAFFSEYDLLLGPTLACVSWPLDLDAPATIGGRKAAPRGHAVFTPLFNHSQSPAITIPCGAGRNALPVGLQIVGPRLADRQVLAAASWMEEALGERARPWLISPPPMAH